MSAAQKIHDKEGIVAITMRDITGGQIVIQTLHDLGVQTIFSVSGNQILPIYDAAGESGLRMIHMRHESAAAYAATASAEVRNQPGTLLVSAGPAFVAALAGVTAAKSLEVPLLFLSRAWTTEEDHYAPASPPTTQDGAGR